MTRRSFLAAAFGTAAARALPDPIRHFDPCTQRNLFGVPRTALADSIPTNLTDSSGVLTREILQHAFDQLIAFRDLPENWYLRLPHSPCGGYCEDPGHLAAISSLSPPDGYSSTS